MLEGLELEQFGFDRVLLLRLATLAALVDEALQEAADVLDVVVEGDLVDTAEMTMALALVRAVAVGVLRL